MSLLSDPDYLIHSLRLAYLRHVEDPYGPRMLSLNTNFTSNPHILASGLADHETWPEIVMPSTPSPTDEGHGPSDGRGNKRHSGFPGATGLKYSQTIVGMNRTGGMGIRVSGKRSSMIRKPSIVSEASGTRHRADSAPTPVSFSPVSRQIDASDKAPSSTILKRRSVDVAQLESPATNGAVKVEPFRPHHEHSTDTGVRQRVRVRSGLAPVENLPSSDAIPESSSVQQTMFEDDEDASGGDSDSLGDDAPLDVEEAVEDGFFDLESEFGPRIVLASSVSDGTLSMTNSNLSMSQQSLAVEPYNASILNVRPFPLARLSPVQEVRAQNSQHLHVGDSLSTAPRRQNSEQLESNVTPQRTFKSDGSYFELVVPPPPSKAGQTGGVAQSHSAQVLVAGGGAPASSTTAVTSASELAKGHSRQSSSLSFTRVKVSPVPSRPPVSALSQMLASKAQKVDNPFAELYSLISSRSNQLELQLIYPFSNHPTRAVTLKIRSDAIVEEAIGFALWTYWEEGFEPKLDEGLGGADDPRRKDKLSAAGWSLRITEDGEVDDDFPAMERMAKMSKFNFEGYAIMPETPAQSEQNRLAEAKIQRRPSRVMVAKKKPSESAAQTLAPPGTNVGVTSSSVTSAAPMSSSVGGGSTFSQGPQQFLRIKVAEKADVHYMTTVPVKESMYMEEVLESVCRRRRIDDAKQWCLVYDMKILVPLDRTVASLQGKTELFLVKRENLSQYDIRRQQSRSTDPNASIFSRISEVPEQQYSAALDFTSAYKKYTVYRKMPMLVVRHERILAMDGDYIHIMPSATRAFLDSMKTSSYHIKSVIACVQSARTSSNFKLVVWRDGGNKRYDFEAESPKIAAEIVRSIKDLKTKRLERSVTLNHRPRRNRHPG